MSPRPHGSYRQPVVEVSYGYVYYPEAEVYYHPQRHLYYWADGGSWRSGSRAPQRYVLRSGVNIQLDSSEPYRHHDQVRSQYPRHQGDARGPSVGVSYSYVYYPDAEVYYYPQRRVYYWNDRGTWRSGSRAPSTFVLRAGVTINLDSPEPYRHHDQVRSQHPRRQEQDRRERDQDRHDRR